jgi:hypothetical protein
MANDIKTIILKGRTMPSQRRAKRIIRSTSRRLRTASITLLCAGGWGLCVVPSALASDVTLPHVESGDGRAPSVFAQAVTRVLAYFSDEDDSDDGAQRVNAAGRGSDAGPLSMPLIATPVRQSMVAGTRQFYLAWIGGLPPYDVRITGPSGEIHVAWQPTGQRAVVATISLREGPYEVRLTDAGAQSVLGGFDVAARGPPADAQFIEALPADQRRAVLAARLSAIDDGTWQLEAYEQLAAVHDSKAAAIIARRLVGGRSIAELGAKDIQ